jgi:acyl-CoA thioester hydrolase
VGGATRLKFERHTEILRASDRALLAKALTIWCPIDVHTGRPTTVSPDVRALFALSPTSA